MQRRCAFPGRGCVDQVPWRGFQDPPRGWMNVLSPSVGKKTGVNERSATLQDQRRWVDGLGTSVGLWVVGRGWAGGFFGCDPKGAQEVPSSTRIYQCAVAHFGPMALCRNWTLRPVGVRMAGWAAKPHRLKGFAQWASLGLPLVTRATPARRIRKLRG